MSYPNETHDDYISQEQAEDAQAGLDAIEKFKRDTCENFALLVKGISAWSANKKLVAESLPSLCEAIDDVLYEVTKELSATAGSFSEPSDFDQHNTMNFGAGGSL